MKKLLATFALVLMFGQIALAQKSNGDTVVGVFTALDNGSCQSSASCAWMVFPANGFPQGVIVYSTGSWVGSISVQIGSGGNWQTVSTNTTNFTSTNITQTSTTDIRVLMRAYTSGTATVTISRNLAPNTTTIQFPGAAAGSCFANQQAVNSSNGDLYSCSAGSWVKISGGGSGSGTVTEVDTTTPLSGGPITGSGTIACATCAIGPGSSTANHIAEFASTDGVTLKDGGAASNGISGQAAGVIPLGSTATTIGAQSHCDDGVTTSATVTCSEPITSTGAGTFGGSGPSTFSAGIQIEGGSKLATSNQTGTGNIVLATSPTLVTPALGTPSALVLTNATGLPGASIVGASVTATQLAAQYSKGQCTELWGGSGTSFALTSGDDAIADNACYNDSGVTRTITAVKARSDNGSNTTTVNPTFGAEGTGTTICSGALTAGSSLAYSSTCTVSNASWTTGTGINPVMGGTLTGTSIAVLIEYTF